MQKADDAKTKSAPKFSGRLLKTAGLVMLALGMLALPFAFFAPPSATLQAADYTYELMIAATEQAQQKGLGGRAQLAQDHGMLFVFEKPAAQCFWMKDMRFPIDIIWLDSAKRVTYVAPNVAPDSYPQQYCGDATTKYVIELNAGEVQRAGIKLGDRLKL